MPQWLWKVAQAAVFLGLTVGLYEVADRRGTLLAAMIIAFGLTALIFAPFLHLQDWLIRRKSTRANKRLNKGGPSG
jgi:uncharacterized membrane protein YdfJ with MMPL/SSD domain